jgi:hypothetical protein
MSSKGFSDGFDTGIGSGSTSDFGQNVGYHNNPNHPGQLKNRNSNNLFGHGGGDESELEARKVQRFVSVHIAPPEEPTRQRGPPSPPKKPDTNYQIVFIKAPSPTGPDGQLELQVPPPPETKTLVYVLLKKPTLDLQKLKALQQNKNKPSPPEVFFIRYKGNNKPQQGQDGHNNGKAQTEEDMDSDFEGLKQQQQSSFPQKGNDEDEYGIGIN